MTSDGTLATTMIGVVGESQQQAKSDITAAGLTGTISYSYVKADTAANTCKVQSTNPATGTSMSKTDPITLTVYGKLVADASGSYDPGALCPQ